MPTKRTVCLRAVALRVALVSAAIILPLGAAEVLLRVTGYGEANKSHFEKFMEYDPLLGWRHKRNFSGVVIGKDYHTIIHYNARGIRGEELPYTKPRDVYRVVVLGGSFVDGYSVEEPEELTQVLQKDLGLRFQVVNLGVAGYSTVQDLLLFEQEGRKYQPDLAVLLFTYRDVWANGRRDMMGQTQKPVFIIDSNGRLTLANVPVPYPSRNFLEKLKIFEFSRAVIKKNVTLYAAAIKIGVAHGTLPKEWPLAPAGAAGLVDEFVVYQKTESSEVKRRWAVTRALLRRMKQETIEQGVGFLTFYVPMRVELSADEWMSSHIPQEYDPRKVANTLIEICQLEGVPYIDPSDKFKQVGLQKRLYYPNDAHWTAAGHQLAGAVLANYVRTFQNTHVRPTLSASQ